MAAYFWVGGSGTWDSTTTTHWATSSGGSGGAGVPTSGDSVTFDSASNSPSTAYTVTMGTGAVCLNMSMTGPTTGQVTWAGTTDMSVYGNFTLSGTGTNTGVSATYTGTLTFAGSATQTVTTNGVTINGSIVASGSGSFTISGAFTCSGSYTSSGTKATDFGITTATFSSVTFGATSSSLSFGTVGLVLTGSGTCFSETVSRGSIIYYGTSVISATSSSPKTMSFYPSNTYPGINQGGTGALTVTTSTGTGKINLDGCTFKNSVQPATILVTGGLTIGSIGKLQLNGTAGNLVTLSSTNTTPVTLESFDVGVQIASYCSVSYMTGSNTSYLGGTGVLWRFLNSTNGGNNTNVTFASQYYWVGGTGTWNNSSTTNWSLTSGGAGSAGVPTAADDVYFDTASASPSTAYTVTMGTSASCFNMTMSGPTTGQVTWAGSTAMSIYGSMTLSGTATNGGINRTYSGAITFAGTYTGFTVTTNGVLMYVGTITFNGVGGSWTLGSAITSNAIVLTNGTFDTSTSNYAVTLASFASNNSNTRTLKLNASTWTVTGGGDVWNIATSTGMTLTPGTSTINLSGVGNAYFGGLTYYNVVLNSGNIDTISYNILDTGTNTFNTFTFNSASAAPSLNTLTLSGNINTATLGLNNTGAITRTIRLNVFSDTPGTARTLTVSSSVSIGVVDFRDITFAGLYAPYSSTYSGDCGGNSGLTFPAAKTVYWNLAGTQNWSATGWATSSGGTPAAANFPLAQDTVIFDNTGSVGTVTIDKNWNIGTVDMSGRTSAMTLVISTSPIIYGLWGNGSGTTLSGTGTLTFSNRSTKTINSAGKTFTQLMIIDAPGGGVQLLTNNLTSSAGDYTLTLTRGTLDLNNLTFSGSSFYSSNSNTRTIAFGTSGQITCTGSTGWFTGIVTNLTVTGTAVVNLTSASTAASTGSPTEANAISFNITNYTGTTLSFPGTIGGAFKSVNFTGSTGTWLNFNGVNGGVTCYGNVTLATGMTTGTQTASLTFAATSATNTITTNGVTINFPIIINGSGLTVTPIGALTSSSSITLTNGVFGYPSTSYALTVSSFTAAAGNGIYYGSGTWTITGSTFTLSGTPSFTSSSTGHRISMTSASTKTFVGATSGGFTNTILEQAGAGTLTISGTNTFADIQASSLPSTIIFPASVTTTVSAFTAKGTAGNLLTLQSSSSGSQFTLSKSSGIVLVDYLSLKDSNAIGGAQWRAGLNSTIVSNVSGWLLFGLPTQIRVSINSSGVLFVPGFNQLDEVSKSINSVDNNAVYSNLFDETQSLDYNGIPVVQRKTADGQLLVSGYFDETTLQ